MREEIQPNKNYHQVKEEIQPVVNDHVKEEMHPNATNHQVIETIPLSANYHQASEQDPEVLVPKKNKKKIGKIWLLSYFALLFIIILKYLHNYVFLLSHCITQ